MVDEPHLTSCPTTDLLGVSAASLPEVTSPQAGPILESFVVSEIVRPVAGSDLRVSLYHYRDREQREVDLILESRDGRAVAIDVKAAKSVDETDFRHIRYIRDRLGERFISGIVMHLGTRPLAFGEKLSTLPISALWS